ncbi:helix-turn-helix domain-containing protein [uncultured Bacteroides sp.]|uniref:helix-turn-helix domain-containing protein n=1 Tax=uncultured Bacteroides sp. TaxID=162156 RepID=UPI0025FF6DDF|nr:helix-turn-helix transcriptional regulator [uncultured Bacteroides sp.]
MEIKDRIRMIMEREKVPPRVFAETIGVQQSTLSHILNDRNKPSLEVVMKVHQKYNYVNLEWLLYGKGEMLASDEELVSSSNGEFQPSLFDENPVNLTKEPNASENRKEMPLRSTENAPKEIIKQEIRYIEKPARKITEIRIFFDDNTYETFRPEK